MGYGYIIGIFVIAKKRYEIKELTNWSPRTDTYFSGIVMLE